MIYLLIIKNYVLLLNIDGGDLENYTKNRRLKEEEIIKIFLKFVSV